MQSASVLIKDKKTSQIAKKLKKIKKTRQLIVRLKTPEQVFSETMSVFLFGDIFIPLPEPIDPPESIISSQLNHYKVISSIVYKKSHKTLEMNLSTKAYNSMNFEPFIQILIRKNDQDYYELSNLVKIYAEFMKARMSTSDKKFEDAPLINSVENYQHEIEQQFTPILARTDAPSFYMKYYFNPFSNEMHLSMMGYTELFVSLMGVSMEKLQAIIKAKGLFNFLHPKCQIRFMIFVIKMSLGMSSTHSFEELDLLTFDGIIIPFKLKITPFAGKPNSDGYFEVYFIFELLINQNMYYQLSVTRARNSIWKNNANQEECKNSELKNIVKKEE